MGHYLEPLFTGTKVTALYVHICLKRMPHDSRHQCLIYEGSPARHLTALTALIRQHLNKNYRCLYLNSPPMVAGMRSYLYAAGVDVPKAVMEGKLVLSSDRGHLNNGSFDIDRMLTLLNEAVAQALKDGYQGLWVTGDMSWEFGPEKGFSKLMEYEWRLEELFHAQPALSGICQYHADTLPPEVMKTGLMTHQSIFINETLSQLNAHYFSRKSSAAHLPSNADLDTVITRLCNDRSAR
jgi:hypothetical protein